MTPFFIALLALIASTFRTRAALQAEIVALRHQIAVLQQSVPRRLRLRQSDRLLWIWLSRFWPGWRRWLRILKPDTVLRWHRRAFTRYWTRSTSSKGSAFSLIVLEPLGVSNRKRSDAGGNGHDVQPGIDCSWHGGRCGAGVVCHVAGLAGGQATLFGADLATAGAHRIAVVGVERSEEQTMSLAWILVGETAGN